MGSRGPDKSRALITFGGIASKPSDHRLEIETRAEVTLSERAWRRIDRAWRHFDTSDAMSAAPPIKGKDREAFAPSVRRAKKRLAKALGELDAQANERAANKAIGRLHSVQFQRELDCAIELIRRLETFAMQAKEPESVNFSTGDAEAAALKEIAVAVEGEFSVEFPQTLGKAGLSDFQRLIRALDIWKPAHATEASDEAFAKWLRRRMAENS